jgi:hypothetical protein
VALHEPPPPEAVPPRAPVALHEPSPPEAVPPRQLCADHEERSPPPLQPPAWNQAAAGASGVAMAIAARRSSFLFIVLS